MIAFPSMLIGAAELANMKIPPNADDYHEGGIKQEKLRQDFPHFYCFCVLQLGKPVRYHGEHWDNAKIIAAVPDDKIMTLKLEDFLDLGLNW